MLISNRLNRFFPVLADDPWRLLAALGEQFLNDVEPSPMQSSTRVRAWKSSDGLIIDIDLPGRAVDDLDVSLEGRRLEVRAKPIQSPAEGSSGQERGRDGVAWQWKLPFDPQPDATRVSYNNGVLRISLQQTPAMPRHKLVVNAE